MCVYLTAKVGLQCYLCFKPMLRADELYVKQILIVNSTQLNCCFIII